MWLVLSLFWAHLPGPILTSAPLEGAFEVVFLYYVAIEIMNLLMRRTGAQRTGMAMSEEENGTLALAQLQLRELITRLQQRRRALVECN